VVPKSVMLNNLTITLDGVMAVILPNSVALCLTYVEWLKIDPYCIWQKCSRRI